MQKEAAKQGFQQVLWLYGDDHQLTEVGTMNVFVLMINEHGGNLRILNTSDQPPEKYLSKFLITINNFLLERELITPPLNGLILPGVVRHSILNLTREWNQIKVTERRITMEEVKKAVYENRVSVIN